MDQIRVSLRTSFSFSSEWLEAIASLRRMWGLKSVSRQHTSWLGWGQVYIYPPICFTAIPDVTTGIFHLCLKRLVFMSFSPVISGERTSPDWSWTMFWFFILRSRSRDIWNQFDCKDTYGSWRHLESNDWIILETWKEVEKEEHIPCQQLPIFHECWSRHN